MQRVRPWTHVPGVIPEDYDNLDDDVLQAINRGEAIRLTNITTFDLLLLLSMYRNYHARRIYVQQMRDWVDPQPGRVDYFYSVDYDTQKRWLKAEDGYDFDESLVLDVVYLSPIELFKLHYPARPYDRVGE